MQWEYLWSLIPEKIWEGYDEVLDNMNKNPVVTLFRDHGTAASVALDREISSEEFLNLLGKKYPVFGKNFTSSFGQ